MTPMVSVRGLTFSYSKNEKQSVFKDISVDFPAGSIVAIMGVNGSGKTTFLNCLIGQLPIPHQTVLVNGQDIATVPPRQLARMISYVPQTIVCNQSFFVYEYLSLGCLSRKAFWDRPDTNDYDMISEKSKLMGIENLLDKQINQLSGGERQLVVITRALVQDTPIIVMDEPASALDITNQATLLKVLFKLRQLGKTVIFSTHDPNHALSLNAMTCLFHNAGILSFGFADDVLTKETLSSAYGNTLHFVYDHNGKKICCFNL